MFWLFVWLIGWLLRLRGENPMPKTSPFARPVATVDEQLASLVGLNRDAEQQLESVRRQITQLQSHELSLISAVDGRMRRIDLLLDERLLAAEVEITAAAEALIT